MDLRAVFSTVESQVSTWCALELGIDPVGLAKLLSAEGLHREDEIAVQAGLEMRHGYDIARAQAVWGIWFGRESEFFIQAAQLVQGLRWADVVRISGSELNCQVKATERSFAALMASPHLPERVELNHFVTHPGDADTVRITTYSYNDPIQLSHRTFKLLHRFDGRPVEDVLIEIEHEEGVQVDHDLLHALLDYQVLRSSHDQEEW